MGSIEWHELYSEAGPAGLCNLHIVIASIELHEGPHSMALFEWQPCGDQITGTNQFSNRPYLSRPMINLAQRTGFWREKKLVI